MLEPDPLRVPAKLPPLHDSLGTRRVLRAVQGSGRLPSSSTTLAKLLDVHPAPRAGGGEAS